MPKIQHYMYCHLYYKGVKELEIHCHRKNFLPTLIDMWTHETKTMGTYETCMFLSSHRRLPSIFFITDDDFIPDARTHTHPSSRRQKGSRHRTLLPCARRSSGLVVVGSGGGGGAAPTGVETGGGGGGGGASASDRKSVV